MLEDIKQTKVFIKIKDKLMKALSYIFKTKCHVKLFLFKLLVHFSVIFHEVLKF